MYEKMYQAINQTRLVIVKFNSRQKGIIERLCVPFDVGPSKRDHKKVTKFHFYNLDSPSGAHNLSLEPSSILMINVLEEKFNPGNYVTWEKIEWCYPRNCGIFS